MNKLHILAIVLSSLLSIAFAGDADKARQGTGAAETGLLSTITSLIPSAIGNMLPMVLLFGLGAFLVPTLGLGLLLREGRRSEYPPYYRSFPSFKINTSALMETASDVFEKLIKALDNVEKKYD